jgi:hypothetical protein
MIDQPGNLVIRVAEEAVDQFFNIRNPVEPFCSDHAMFRAEAPVAPAVPGDPVAERLHALTRLSAEEAPGSGSQRHRIICRPDDAGGRFRFQLDLGAYFSCPAARNLGFELDVAGDAIGFDDDVISGQVAIAAQQFVGMSTQQEFGCDCAAEMIFEGRLYERRLARQLAFRCGVTDGRCTQRSRSLVQERCLWRWPRASLLCPLGATARKPDVGNLINEQAHAPLPLPAGHARMPPGPGKSVTEFR